MTKRLIVFEKTTTSVFIYLTIVVVAMLNASLFHQTTLISINVPLFVRWRHSFSLRADQPWIKDWYIRKIQQWLSLFTLRPCTTALFLHINRSILHELCLGRITTFLFYYVPRLGAGPTPVANFHWFVVWMIDRSDRYSPPPPPAALFHGWWITLSFIHPFAAGQDNAEGIGTAVARYNKYVVPLTPHLHSDSPVVIDSCIAFLGNYFHRSLAKHWCSDLSQVHLSNDCYT